MDEASCEICGHAFIKKRKDQKYCAACKDRIKKRIQSMDKQAVSEKASVLHCMRQRNKT